MPNAAASTSEVFAENGAGVSGQQCSAGRLVRACITNAQNITSVL
jgi:hypothetical protein